MEHYRRVELDFVPWTPEAGTPVEWEDGAVVAARVDSGAPLIEGNAAGLRSLARLLLTLAAEDVPAGTHVHLAEFSGLQPGSAEIIVERAPEGSSAGLPGA